MGVDMQFGTIRHFECRQAYLLIRSISQVPCQIFYTCLSVEHIVQIDSCIVYISFDVAH